MAPASVDSGRLQLAFGLTLGAGMATTLGALAPWCAPGLQNKRVLSAALAFASGVMIYVSFVEIVPKANTHFSLVNVQPNNKRSDGLTHLFASITLFVGMTIAFLLDVLVHWMKDAEHFPTKEIGDADSQQEPSLELASINSLHVSPPNTPLACGIESPKAVVPEADVVKGADNDSDLVVDIPKELSADQHAEAEKERILRTTLVTALAITLHNLPEGLCTFVATLSDPAAGASVAVAIAIHNIPEGMAVSLPAYYATGDKWTAFWWATFSGLSEPIGALIGYALLNQMFGEDVFGVMFGLVGGIMLYISFRELLPLARKDDPNDNFVSWFLFLGFIVMDVSLLLFAF